MKPLQSSLKGLESGKLTPRYYHGLRQFSIYHHEDGLCRLAKRLERGRFVWPQATSGSVSLSRAQLSMLLEGATGVPVPSGWQPFSTRKQSHHLRSPVSSSRPPKAIPFRLASSSHEPELDAVVRIRRMPSGEIQSCISSCSCQDDSISSAQPRSVIGVNTTARRWSNVSILQHNTPVRPRAYIEASGHKLQTGRRKVWLAPDTFPHRIRPRDSGSRTCRPQCRCLRRIGGTEDDGGDRTLCRRLAGQNQLAYRELSRIPGGNRWL